MGIHLGRESAKNNIAFVCLFLSIFLFSCESMYYGGLPQGDPIAGYGITGFISSSPGSAAPGETVVLVEMASGRTVGSVQADAMGKYTFYPVKTGSYQVRVNRIRLPATVTASHVRLDVDLSAPDGRMNYASAALKQKDVAEPSRAAPGESASGAAADQGMTATAGGVDGQLKQLLLSSAWCSFSYSKSSGVTKSGRVRFFANGTYSTKRRSEGYSSGSGGTFASQGDSGSDGHWNVRGGRLYISEGSGPLEPVGLKINYNNNGAPILVADGKEYMQCN